MAALVLRSDLVANVRELADMENSQKVTDAEIVKRLDSGARHLYERLIAARGAAYYATWSEATTLSAGHYLTLPADFFQLLGFATQQDGAWSRARSMGLDELARRRNAYPDGASPVGDIRYVLSGDQASGAARLLFFPDLPSGVPYRIDYIPTYLVTTVSAQTYYDGIDGWEEWVVIRAAMFCVAKEERDTGFLAQELAREDARIAALAAARDRSEPVARIRDVYACEDGEGGPSYPWGSRPW